MASRDGQVPRTMLSTPELLKNHASGYGDMRYYNPNEATPQDVVPSGSTPTHAASSRSADCSNSESPCRSSTISGRRWRCRGSGLRGKRAITAVPMMMRNHPAALLSFGVSE
ncbi:MAG: hypothetical protein QOF25_3927 [Mycobacterium sp.]|nr:hypothetical protein [Mycobacterium sp.]